jgi:protein tyrosine phosphatase
VKDQVHALVDTLLDFDAENSFVFIHCAGGIGRTGNIAYGLSEILCSNVPNDPLKKLEWLRSQRQGCIQSPEQLVDGMILSNMILDDVVNRCVSKS